MPIRIVKDDDNEFNNNSEFHQNDHNFHFDNYNHNYKPDFNQKNQFNFKSNYNSHYESSNHFLGEIIGSIFRMIIVNLIFNFISYLVRKAFNSEKDYNQLNKRNRRY